jgi:anaerobic magnesium-protoporphyrin IX monomethyl ester cyclase
VARRLDVLFVTPSSAKAAYQDLAKIHSAIEPPTWALLLAAATRKQGYGVEILDCDALHLPPDRAAQEISDRNPRLVCFVLYGQNPNSGTTSMIGAVEVGTELRGLRPDLKTCFVGSHVSALPKEVLVYDFVDFVLINEGVYAIQQLLATNLTDHIENVEGIGYKDADGNPCFTNPGRLVPQERMDEDLPGSAWDLLPYDKKPLDLYRAHFWHTNFSHEGRTPFAALYTSLGCKFGCNFCMINIVNRTSTDDDVSAADFRGMRHWSPEFMLREFETLADFGVETLRLSDEMFFLNRRYYEPLLNGLIDRGLEFNMWAYARVDSIRPDQLDLFKQAGINWLCLGIEAGNQHVRQDISKGRFQDINIRDVVKLVREHGINVLGNYMFGFPEDTHGTMQQTLDLAVELNTEHANFYPCQALPGSPLYFTAREKNWDLPTKYEEYAFLSYDCKPLPTNYLAPQEVLRFRDDAWQQYFSNPEFLSMIASKFGPEQRRNIQEMSEIRLKRRLLGD